MTLRRMHALVVAGLGAGLAVAAAIPAGAVPGPGTWTKITTPSGAATSVRATDGGTFSVKGQTSLDVTAVDIVCIRQPRGAAPQSYTFASAVPVSSGNFSGTATYATNPILAGPTCRLRAVPSGTPTTDPNTYLGSYAGPILHTDYLTQFQDGSVTYGYLLTGGDGDGALGFEDAARCGTLLLATEPATTTTVAANMPGCAFAVPGLNQAQTDSAITVSGHPAYLPGTVHAYLNGSLGLGLPQSPLAVHMKIAGNGDITITESGPLVRCSAADTFPPTPTSCPALVPAGVNFERVSTFFRDGHQVQVRDVFGSADSQAHTVKLEYLFHFVAPATGALGFSFPGHGSAFHAPALGAKISGLPAKAGTVLVRSDLDASSDDALADTRGLTWSQPPAKISFDGTTPGSFVMPYRLTVHASGETFLGFADSEGVLTSDVTKLASAAAGAMVAKPIISSPHNGATVHGRTTKVKGKVDAGANGLPTKVTVNGHKARLGATSLVHGAWSVKFSEAPGTHTLTVVATDRAGNTASSSVKIRNT